MDAGEKAGHARLSPMRHALVLLLMAAAGVVVANPHQDTIRHVPTSDSLATKKSYLSFSTSYGNNSSFLGRFQTRAMPFLGVDATYLHSTGLWVSAIGYDIVGNGPVMDELDLMAGYNRDLSRRWDVAAYYGRYFFNENTELIKSYVANSASLSAGFDWSVLYSKLTSTYIFGNDVKDIFLILDHSRYFEFPNVLGAHDYISIDPQISLIAGTQTFYEQYLITEERINPGKGKGKGRGKGKGDNPGGPPPETTVVETEKRSFRLMSYEFTLPVMYTRGRWSIETNGRYSVPVNPVAGYLIKPQFFFTSSLYYTISK